MPDRPPAEGHWDQLNKCPVCGADMERAPHVGEQVGLYYRCATHGRFRYSWDDDRLEPAPEPNASRTSPRRPS